MTVETTVETAIGTIRGVASGAVRRFLGVPYAEAPVGALRFAAPVVRAPFRQPFDASRHGATAQRVAPWAPSTIPEPSVPGDDILNLDITTPLEVTHPLPVIVWVHGGGYIAGSPSSPWYDGRSFARDGVIVVSVGYRLGLEGFGPLPGRPGNRGLRDVLLALRWVQAHIADVGGDPDRVTLAGQSAGGGAVLALLGSPSSRGLFSRAVSVSGIDVALDPQTAAERVARLAESLGVAGTAEAFGAIDAESIQRAVLALDGIPPFAPVTGDDVVPGPITGGLGRENLRVPLLLGATADEFDGGPSGEDPGRAAFNPAANARARAAGARVTDTLFRAVVPRVADARAGGETWAYSFEWPSPRSGAATHCIDLPFFFDLLDAPGVPRVLGPCPPAALAAVMHADLVGFAAEGTLPWPVFRGGRGDVVRLYAADGVTGATATDAYDSVTPAGGR